MDYDVITIGAGHNALVASAYLAQAGYRVGVFERRTIVGGAVATQELVPGYRFDLGGSAHILIRLTPILEELRLDRFGLEYLELDPLFFSPFRDRTSVFLHRDVQQTVDALEQQFPGEGKAYGRFVADWRDFSLSVRDAFLASPSPLNIGKHLVWRAKTRVPWTQALSRIMRPYGDVVRDYFSEPKLQAMLLWMAAQSGPPPSEPMTGPFVLWHPLYHEGGIARPRGGSGMLTEALRRHVMAHGGDVHVDAPVEEILVRQGNAVGIRVKGQTLSARAILSGTHIVETLRHLLPENARPPGMEHLRVGNGFGAILRLALDKPVRYRAHPGDEARIGLQLLCESPEHVADAYGQYLQGRPTRKPPIVAMTFSAVDDSLAPPGGEVLWLWAQYYPYELAGGMHWDDIAPSVAENIVDTFEAYAPGTKSSIVGQLFQHPLWLERELGLFRGNVMHLEMSIDQLFMQRPMVSMAQYRSHLPRLYLTGASTHPGGGIMGASGRNAARVLLKDLDKKKI